MAESSAPFEALSENGDGSSEDQPNGFPEVYAVAGGSSFFQTLFNSLNVLCGVGLLATPYAAAKMGWLSLLMLFALGSIFLFSGKLIGRCMSDAPWIRTYPDIGKRAFGVRGSIAIAVLLYAELFLTAVEFLILEGDNLSALFPDFQPFGGRYFSPSQAWVLVAALIMLPTVYLRDLRLLAYLSAAGIFASVITAVLVGWEGYADRFPYRDLPLLRADGLPLVVGLLSFNYGGHTLFPSLYAAMKTPQHYPRVLDLTFAGVMVLYALTAVLGYLTFGDAVECAHTAVHLENVTLSMERRDPWAIPTRVAIWITILAPFTKYALVVSPIASGIEDCIPAACTRAASTWAGYKPLPGEDEEQQHMAEGQRRGAWRSWQVSVIVRTALVASTVAVALSVPKFAYVMAFTGGLLGLSACVVVPAVCYLQIKQGLLGWTERSCIGLLAAIGVMLSVLGTTSAVLKILES